MYEGMDGGVHGGMGGGRMGTKPLHAQYRIPAWAKHQNMRGGAISRAPPPSNRRIGAKEGPLMLIDTMNRVQQQQKFGPSETNVPLKIRHAHHAPL